MLILKEPIKLKSLFPMVYIFNGFWERMDGNYRLIQANYSPEELFHLMIQAPEIYLEEGGMTTLVTQSLNQANQEMRIEMVHNLFNRLIMADSNRFTYQDTVYVQSMLEKLGIQNISEFMKQLYLIQEDTKNLKQLSKLYEINKIPLRTMIQSINEEERGEIQEEGNHFPVNNVLPVYWIHNEIFKRLQSVDIYRAVAAFQKDVLHGHNRIGSQEAAMAEQIRTAEALKLKMLENHVFMEESPLMGHRVNIYEVGAGEGDCRKEDIIHELAGAALLNISEGLYQVCMAQLQESRRCWFQFQGDFRQALENTLDRFWAYHFQKIFLGKQEGNSQYQKSVNEFRRQEIHQLNQALGVSQEQPVGILQEGLERVMPVGFFQWEGPDIAGNVPFFQGEEPGITGEIQISQEEKQEIMRERLVSKEFGGQEMEEGRIYHVSGLNELQVLEEINQISRTLENNAGDFPATEEQARIFKEEIYRLNEENRRKLEETEHIRGTVQKSFPVRIDRERTRKETLLLLEHPELADKYFGKGFGKAGFPEQFHKEKKPFLAYLESREKSRDAERVPYIQETLPGEKPRKADTSNSEEISKKVAILQGSLKEFLRFRRETSQVLMKEIKTENLRKHVKEAENLKEHIQEASRKTFQILRKEKEAENLKEHIREAEEKEKILQMLGGKEVNFRGFLEQASTIRHFVIPKIAGQEESVQQVFSEHGLRFYHKEPQVVTVEMGKGKTGESIQVQQEEKTVKEQNQTQTIVAREQIHTQAGQLGKINAEDITELIQRGIQRQINSISEQVCHKLEKKLSNDRKRRGY